MRFTDEIEGRKLVDPCKLSRFFVSSFPCGPFAVAAGAAGAFSPSGFKIPLWVRILIGPSAPSSTSAVRFPHPLSFSSSSVRTWRTGYPVLWIFHLRDDQHNTLVRHRDRLDHKRDIPGLETDLICGALDHLAEKITGFLGSIRPAHDSYPDTQVKVAEVQRIWFH